MKAIRINDCVCPNRRRTPAACGRGKDLVCFKVGQIRREITVTTTLNVLKLKTVNGEKDFLEEMREVLGVNFARWALRQ